MIHVWWDNADEDGNIDGGSYWRGVVCNYLPDLGAHAFNVQYLDDENRIYPTLLDREKWVLAIDMAGMSLTKIKDNT